MIEGPSGETVAPTPAVAAASAAPLSGPNDGLAEPQPDEAAALSPEVAGDLATIAEVERDLQAVDAAMRRLDDGTYGTCASCGRTIDPATLAADPLRSRCPGCDSGQGRLPV
jgi:RNA polymerase-binding transcription factor DksA